MNYKVILLLCLIFIIKPGYSQDSLVGKWTFDVDKIQNSVTDWLQQSKNQQGTLEGKEKAKLEKEIKMVEQIQGSINFSYSGMVYIFSEGNKLKIISTKGNVGTTIDYITEGNILKLFYPHMKEPLVYRYEFSDKQLVLYEIVDNIERFGLFMTKTL